MGIKIVKFFNQLGRGTAIDLLTRFVSHIPFLSIFWVLVTLAIFFLDEKNGLRIAIAMTISIGLHAIITAGMLKRGLGRYHKRIRPYMAYPKEIVQLGKKETDTSFPSRHMSANVSLVAVLAYFYPAIWLVAGVWVLLMAFARLHNGMHYLSDVAVGSALGILYGIAGIYLVGILLSFDFLRKMV